MAIAVVPEPPESRWARLGNVLVIVVCVVVLALFAYSLLDAYVF